MSLGESQRSTAIHPAFERDVFHLRPALLATAETHQVSDEEGTLLLEATSPPRLLRLLTAVLLSTSIFLVVTVAAMMLIVYAAHHLHVKREMFAPLFFCGFVLSFMLGVLAVICVLLRLLGPNHITFYAEEAKGYTLLELRPHRQYLGFGTTYEVRNEQGASLATVRTNHVYNLFRERWRGARPDGHPCFIATENSIVPRVIRLAMRGAVAFLFLATLLIALVVAIITFINFAPLGIPLLLSLGLLVPLAAFVLVGSVLAFLLRKLVPLCSIVRPDDQITLGEFRRETDAPSRISWI